MLLNNFIFNRGAVEGTEYEKIIYSTRIGETTSTASTCESPSADPCPTDPEVKDDLKQISLCEASTSFVQLFKKKSSKVCDLPISMEGYGGTVLIFRLIEKPGFWLIAVAVNSNCDSDCDQYHLLYQFLGRVYSSYVRQCGTFKHSLGDDDVNNKINHVKLRKKCYLFFQWFLPHALPESGAVSLLISPAMSFGNRPEGLLKYISPFDSSTFITVRSFLSHAKFSYSMDSRIFMVFLYNENLVTSTLCMSATRILYMYITTNVLPEALCDELSWEKKRSNLNTYWYSDRKPILLYLPEEDANDLSDCKWTKRDIYIYRSLNGATLAVILDTLDSFEGKSNIENERKIQLDSIELYAKQHIYNLAATIAKASLGNNDSANRTSLFHSSVSTSSGSGTPEVDTGLYFLYYNEANGALKVYPTSFQPSMSRQSSSTSLLNQHNSANLSLSKTEILRSWIALESDLRTFLKDKNSVDLVDCEPKEAATSSRTERCELNECEEISTGPTDLPSNGLVEILAKTEPDEHWLLVRKVDERFLYATLTSHKNLNLEEVAAVCNNKLVNSKSFIGSHPEFVPFAQLFQ